jgi:iron complex outermembrane receptor protein
LNPIRPLALPLLFTSAAALAQGAPTAQELPAVNVRAPRPDTVTPNVLGTPGGDTAQAPAQVSTVPTETLREPGTQSLSSALATLPSVGENYAIIGYYENFSIRGYTLDLGSAYRINGFVVPGELHLGLDNKQRIEVLQGVGTLAAGATGPGGIMNFVTKRAENVRAARFELNQQGGSYAGFDFGTTGERLGLRINAAHEEMRPYADRANGTRNFLSVALDARPTDSLTLTADLEYQRRSQPAVPGYQLLGGTTIPTGIDPATNINQQPWTRPVQNEATFVGLRADWRIAPGWRLNAGAGQGIARIADNLAFPYGCNTAPVQFFCANGDYVLYDYHSAERRSSTQFDAAVTRQWQSGALAQTLALGADSIERRVTQRDNYSTTNFDAAGLGQSGNLYNVTQALPAPVITTSTNLAPTRARQSSFFLADTLEWQQWRAHLALRLTRISQQTPGAGAQPSGTHTLPQFALTRLITPQSRVYLSYARGLEFGSEAPTTAENSGALLAPRKTKQLEAGYKQEWNNGATLSAAVFRMSRPYDYIEPTGNSFAGLGLFKRAGDQVHLGAEVNAQFPVTRQLRLHAAATYLRARAENTGVTAYEGMQVQNIPRLRSALTARYAFEVLAGLEGILTWLHTGARNARADGTVSVPGYDRFDAGLSYVTRIAGQKATWQLKVTNLTDKRYWRDVGYAYSADLLFPGAPRQVFAGVLIENP